MPIDILSTNAILSSKCKSLKLQHTVEVSPVTKKLDYQDCDLLLKGRKYPFSITLKPKDHFLP